MGPSSTVVPEHSHAGLQNLRVGGAVLLNLLLITESWGQWRAVIVLALMLPALTFINVVIVERLAQRTNRNTAEMVRMLVSALSTVLCGPIVDWSVVLWLYIPLNMIWLHGPGGMERTRAAIYLVFINTAALLSGCELLHAIAFSLLGVISFLIAEQRTAMLQGAMREIIQQREQIQQIHQHALEQEKLSSLGMMAAGVAHEINNPMSFVTSNVSSLYKDLKRQPELPEPLKEYVEDVLPATLDGIKRVNTIVADLRRFARGDKEPHTEYDLNTEAQAALRIAQGQLGHVHVETDLGEVGRLMGWPQQIAQVLVNLLVNAGQATAPGGRVSLSTRASGDMVQVKVRDTGTGMPPEVLRSLFQPFFTTKPPGQGTGLGLSVVHGIITAHGGRIDVESQPGQGSCFTLHLPRVPSQPEEAAASSPLSMGGA